MSFFNQRGIFMQLLAPTLVNPNEAQVSMQLARKELGWDAENEMQTETLVDSTFLTAVSSDGGRTFSIRTNPTDVDGNRVIDDEDKAKLLTLAVAYSSIVNP